MRIGLQSGELSVVGHLGDTIIREVSTFGENHLLIAESASVNRRRIQRVSWFDLTTGETADLYAGTRARFLPGGNVVVYDDGSELFAVPQMDGSANRLIYTHAKNQLAHMTKTTDNILLFESGFSENAQVYSWNSNTGELQAREKLTEVCRLEGSVWIDSLNQLACMERQGSLVEAQYVLTDLDGNISEKLEIGIEDQFRVIAHIESRDALVIQQISEAILGSRNQYSILIHDLQSGENHRVPGNINLGKTAVYAQ